MHSRHKHTAIILAVMLALASFIGCGQKSPSKKPLPKAQSKPPQEIQAISSSIQSLEDMLSSRRMAYNGTRKQVQSAVQGQNKTSMQSKGSQGSNSGSADKSGSSISQSSSTGKVNQSAQQTAQGGKQTNQQNTSDDWSKESREVVKLHESWNKLEPKAVTKGLSSATQSSMEMALSDLTHAIDSHSLVNAELQANQVYRYNIECSAVFASPVPPALGRVQYHIKESRIQGNIGEWRTAHFEALSALDTWRRLSYSLSKIDRNQLHQTEQSIIDVRNAVDNLSPVVTDVKAEIAISNLQQIEKKLKTTIPISSK